MHDWIFILKLCLLGNTYFGNHIMLYNTDQCKSHWTKKQLILFHSKYCGIYIFILYIHKNTKYLPRNIIFWKLNFVRKILSQENISVFGNVFFWKTCCQEV